MSYNEYIPLSEKEYHAIKARYAEFLKDVGSPTAEPIKVHTPFTPKQLEDVMLVREISMELQRKKEEEMKKAQTAEAAQVEIQEAKENGTTETAEVAAKA